MTDPETERAARLLDAQAKAESLFQEVTDRGMIRAGVTERELSNEIRDLAADMFGVTRHWHKRIVRAGENTLETYRANPPDRVIADDEIAFLDFGPIFEEWEADFGRTFVLGDDPAKHALAQALPVIWAAGREYFRTTPDMTGAQLFDHVVALSEDAGFIFGGQIAGHLVGEFHYVFGVADSARSSVAARDRAIHRPAGFRRATSQFGRPRARSTAMQAVRSSTW
ncbi:M24 family metallopeptidase [Gordonia sp. VNQ95]|uniref:M24 family metallopeptidase n=1 Tax=Gordonia sp. VNQ95 TaxID=3156619 RepID=UPI0032B3995F